MFWITLTPPSWIKNIIPKSWMFLIRLMTCHSSSVDGFIRSYFISNDIDNCFAGYSKLIPDLSEWQIFRVLTQIRVLFARKMKEVKHKNTCNIRCRISIVGWNYNKYITLLKETSWWLFVEPVKKSAAV